MDRHNANRYNLALQVLEIAEQEGKALVETLKTAVAALEEQTKTNSNPNESPSMAMDTTDKGKGKAREADVSDDEEEASEGADLSPNASQSTKKGALNNRLRDATITLHRVHFVLGDVYHILGRNAEEEASYASAEALRRNVLQASEKDAETSMADLMSRASDAGLEEDALLIELPFLTQGHKIREIEDRRRRARSSDRAAAGLSPLPSSSEEDSDDANSDLEVKKKKKKPKKPKRLSKVIEEVNFIVEEVLHKQANLIWQWRSRISELLTRRLTPGEGDGADGQEYQRSLDDQGEVESYMQAYSSLLADYREALTKERNLLAAHDARQKKTRNTKAAVKAIADEAPLKIREGVELNDAHHELHENLTFQRRDLLMDLNQRAVKSCLTEIRERIGKIKGANDPEKLLLLEASSMIQAVISEKNQLINKFETDLARFRKVFNYRVIYFAQLQEISDSVAQPTIETTLEDTIAEITTQLETLNLKINTGRSRDRYLKHLAEGGMEGQSVDDEERVCILCRCDFVRGYITQCAHIFCEPCLKLWTSRPEGKTCPVCRSAIEVQAMEAFTTTEIEKPAETSEAQDNTVPKSRRVIEYNQIDPDLLTEIQAIKSFGDFGSKIQTLVKHLLYLQTTEPGSKSICFSAWSDSLLILERALKDNDITCLRIDKNGHSAAQKFRTDPNIQVLLLHGERENAGLNVTCASRVFLLESVVHHGFEIQAIARIDRMGQTRSTEVFCYYAEETVERSILDLAARQGLSLYTKDNAAGTLNVTKFQGGNTQNPKSKEAKLKKSAQKGDFIGKVDDMLAVLFPHMYEDVEYLIDGNDTDVEDDADDDRMITSQMEIAAGTSTRAPRTRRPPQVNAEAGPSRIRR
ncbi:hypothetical protein ONZ45_g5672 [Pleurotus djamor]|nr:hypothetical protein ONZ45_g5672 [Pleurotus djamor]